MTLLAALLFALAQFDPTDLVHLARLTRARRTT
jgi:hypothetical protein